MTGLFQWGGGLGPTMKKFGFGEGAIAGAEGLNKPPPAPPEPVVAAPPVEAPPPAEAPPTPLAAETPAATPPPAPPKVEPVVTPLPDPYAGKRGEVARLAQSRARRATNRATIIGSDTLG